MSKISKSVMDKINHAEVKMMPRWVFVFLNMLMVSMVALTVFLGAGFFAAFFERMFGIDFDLWSRAGGGVLGGMKLAFPAMWVILIIFMLIISKYIFAKTNRGYKYYSWMIVMGCFVLSVVGGFGLWKFGAGHHMENFARSHMPFYQDFRMQAESKLNNPFFGMIAGEVSYSDEIIMELVDNFGEKWSIDVSMAKLKGPKYLPEVGDIVFVMGDEHGFGYFKAIEVRIAPPNFDFRKKV